MSILSCFDKDDPENPSAANDNTGVLGSLTGVHLSYEHCTQHFNKINH